MHTRTGRGMEEHLTRNVTQTATVFRAVLKDHGDDRLLRCLFEAGTQHGPNGETVLFVTAEGGQFFMTKKGLVALFVATAQMTEKNLFRLDARVGSPGQPVQPVLVSGHLLRLSPEHRAELLAQAGHQDYDGPFVAPSSQGRGREGTGGRLSQYGGRRPARVRTGVISSEADGERLAI